MNPFTLSLDALRRRTSAKWVEYQPDVLPLWVAEMDVPLAEPIAEALRGAIERGDTGYATGAPYAEALCTFAAQRWSWAIDESAVAIVPDVMLGIVEALKLVTRPGDTVIVNSPVYPPFYAFIEHMDRQVAEAPLGANGRIDFDALEAAFTPSANRRRPSAYLLCSPHNPTGTVHRRDELETVAQLAATHGVRVVADEIHAPVVPAGASFVPYLTVEGAQRGVSLLSASKAWNLAGIKAAVAVAGPEAVDDLARMPEEVSDGASHLGVIAHAAALTRAGGWLDDMLHGLDENRRLLERLLRDRIPLVRYRPPDGTYLAWLDCRDLDIGDDPATMFLQNGRVALASGLRFGTGGEGHARMNIATSPAIIAEAVDRMVAALERTIPARRTSGG